MAKIKYTDLQKEEVKNAIDLVPWQKQLIDDRLSDYYKDPNHVEDFDKIIDDIETNL